MAEKRRQRSYVRDYDVYVLHVRAAAQNDQNAEKNQIVGALRGSGGKGFKGNEAFGRPRLLAYDAEGITKRSRSSGGVS